MFDTIPGCWPCRHVRFESKDATAANNQGLRAARFQALPQPESARYYVLLGRLRG